MQQAADKRPRTGDGTATSAPLQADDIHALLRAHEAQPEALVAALDALLSDTPDDQHPQLYRVLIEQASDGELGTAQLVYTVLLSQHRLRGGGALNEDRLNAFSIALCLRAMRMPLVHTDASGPCLPDLPSETLQLIAWQLGHLGRVDEWLPDNRHFLGALGQLLLVNKALARAVAPLMRVVRWALHGKALWREARWAEVCAQLMDNPWAAHGADARVAIVAPGIEQAKADWLDALLQAITNLGAEGDAASAGAALANLFQTASRPANATGPRLPHLPLQGLALRLINTEPSLNTYLMSMGGYEIEPMAPDHPALVLLLDHLPGADPEVKLFVLASLLSAFEDFDQDLQERLLGFVQQHAEQLREASDRIQRWNAGFFGLPEDQVDPEVVDDVVQGLQAVPVLGSEISVRLLRQLCNSAALRAMATDAVLIRLLARLMLNIGCTADTLHEQRVAYLFEELPSELGVAAFNTLPTPQRIALLRTGHGESYRPYLQAFTRDARLAIAVRVAVFLDMRRRMHADDTALPPARLQGLARL